MKRRKQNPWKPVQTHDYPGVVLRPDGRLQIGMQVFTVPDLPAESSCNGIRLVKEQDGDLLLEREGIARCYRFDGASWCSSEARSSALCDDSSAPLTWRDKARIAIASSIAFLFFPICFTFMALAAVGRGVPIATMLTSSLGYATSIAALVAAVAANGYLFWYARGLHLQAAGRKQVSALAASIWIIVVHNFLLALCIVFWPIGVIAIIGLFATRLRKQPEPVACDKPRTLQDAEGARRKQAHLLKMPRPVVPWGGLLLPVDGTPTHFAFVGNTGSGKTVNLRVLMQAVLPNLVATGDVCFPRGRAVVFDPKTEFLPIIRGMGVAAEFIKVMNPFDERGVPWDIAKDTPTKADAKNVAEILIPEEKGEQPFFRKATRDIVTATIHSLTLARRDDWTFRDLVLMLFDASRLKALVDRFEETRHVVPKYLARPDLFADIDASLRTIVSDYETAAACWHQSTQKPFSINEWMQSQSILVLGHDDTKAPIFRALNRCLIHKISNVILAPGNANDPNEDRTWLFLDEARDLGKLTGIRELLTRGRSKGCCVVLGFQSIKGMHAVFGRDEASEIVGQCENIAVFRLGNDYDTAKWASDVIGTRDIYEWLEGRTPSPGGLVVSHTQHTRRKHLLPPEELQALPASNLTNGLQGYFVSDTYSVINASAFGIAGDQLFSVLLDREDHSMPAFLAVDATAQSLKPWTAEERRRFEANSQDGGSDWTSLGRLD